MRFRSIGFSLLRFVFLGVGGLSIDGVVLWGVGVWHLLGDQHLLSAGFRALALGA